jgi:hypothetical protein
VRVLSWSLNGVSSVAVQEDAMYQLQAVFPVVDTSDRSAPRAMALCVAQNRSLLDGWGPLGDSSEVLAHRARSPGCRGGRHKQPEGLN